MDGGRGMDGGRAMDGDGAWRGAGHGWGWGMAGDGHGAGARHSGWRGVTVRINNRTVKNKRTEGVTLSKLIIV